MRPRAEQGGLCMLALFACAWSLPCAAQQWQVARASAKQLRIDGELAEWRGARFERIGSDDAGRAEVALAHDDGGLYLAARVFDDKFVRTRSPSPREDALLVALALPLQGAIRESWLYAGRVGESPASAQLGAAGEQRPKALPGAKIVEGPGVSGYVVEAYCPWSSLPGGADWMFARGAVQLHDVDAPNRPARDIPKSSSKGWLAFDGGPINALGPFLSQKDLSQTKPLLDELRDVRGDARVERVLVVGTVALVQNASAEFAFAELPAARAADVRSAELSDLTGDGKAELLLRLAERDSSGLSEVFRVYDLQGASPRALFAAELKREQGPAALSAELELIKGKGPVQLRLRAGRAQAAGVSPSARSGVIAAPSGDWLERVYAWDGARFALRSERANPAPASSAAPPPTAAPASAKPAAVSGNAEALLRAYRDARGLAPDLEGRFEQQANVAEDARLERVQIYDRELVIVGDGFQGGNNFFYLGLPVQSGAHVLGLFTGDVTGDGRSEIFVRVQSQVGPVTRDILLAYTFLAGNFANLLTVEVGRTSGQQTIANTLRLAPAAGHVSLEISPGSARGWTRDNYPFTQDTHDGIEPMLLPWKDRACRYRYDGQRLRSCAGSD